MDWVAYKERIFIFHSSGNPRSSHQHGYILMRAQLLVHSWHLLVLSSHGGRARDLSGVPFYKVANIIYESFSS